MSVRKIAAAKVVTKPKLAPAKRTNAKKSRCTAAHEICIWCHPEIYRQQPRSLRSRSTARLPEGGTDVLTP